jgi:N-dimethylarginine dimethylaminohydrolase
MCEPTYFDIEYAINPYMKDYSGALKTINKNKAYQQWTSLKVTFENNGCHVQTIAGEVGFPDMVFCANQSFPFFDTSVNKNVVILSNMRSKERQGEVMYFKNFYEKLNYKTINISSSFSFESTGDLIFNFDQRVAFGGFGQRTSRDVYFEIQNQVPFQIISIELTHPDFYHLDTCFSVLNHDCCVLVKNSVSSSSEKTIKEFFKKVIYLEVEQAKKYFAGNCFSIDGKNVVTQVGDAIFFKELNELGFNPIEVDTSEFIKSGGSVFCMKLVLPQY